MILTAACATAPSRDGACAANPAIEYRPEVMRAVADELNTNCFTLRSRITLSTASRPPRLFW